MMDNEGTLKRKKKGANWTSDNSVSDSRDRASNGNGGGGGQTASSALAADARRSYRKAAMEAEQVFFDRVLSWVVTADMKIKKEPLSQAVNDEIALSRKGICSFESAEQYVEFFESLLFEDLKAKMEGELAASYAVRVVSIQSMQTPTSSDDDDQTIRLLRFKARL
jgi:hypothetical protein